MVEAFPVSNYFYHYKKLAPKNLKFLTIVIQLFIASVAFSIAFYLSEFEKILLAFSFLDTQALLASFFLFSISILLTSLRYLQLNNFFFDMLCWKKTFIVHIKSLAYSQFIFPILAQSIGRVYQMRGSADNPEYQIVITFFEKAISAAILLIIVLGFAISLFDVGNLRSINYPYIGIIIVGLCVAAALNFIFVLDRGDRLNLKAAISLLWNPKLANALTLTVFAHFGTLFGMYFLASQFFPDLSVLNTLLVSAFLLLASTLPISISSWGVRELSAIVILSNYGGDSSTSVAFGMSVGAVYFCTVIVLYVLTNILFKENGDNRQKAAKISTGLANSKPAFLISLIFFIGISFPVQFRLPIENGLLTLNIADPVFLIVGLTFFAWWSLRKSNDVLWIVPSFKYGLILFPVILVISFLVGYLSFGSNNWAIINRLFGQVIPYCYLFTGAMLSINLSHDGKLKLFLMLAISLICYAIIQMCLQPLMSVDLRNFLGWSNLSGFFVDRNAYSLFLLLVLSSLLPIIQPSQNYFEKQYFLIAIMALMLFIAGSRSGVFSLLVIFLILFFSNRTLFHNLIPSVIISFMSYGFFVYAHDHFSGINSDSEMLYSRFINPRAELSYISEHRVLTWLPAWETWLDYPFFGAGLGYYFEKYSVVVHNVPLWLLSETGLFGLVLFSLLPLSILRACFIKTDNVFQGARKISLLYGLVIISVYSLTHDVLFQRSIWFFLGFFMACQSVTISKNHIR